MSPAADRSVLDGVLRAALPLLVLRAAAGAGGVLVPWLRDELARLGLQLGLAELQADLQAMQRAGLLFSSTQARAGRAARAYRATPAGRALLEQAQPVLADLVDQIVRR